MRLEKRVTILVSIAVILAIIAISLNIVESGGDVGTNIQKNVGDSGGRIGLTIDTNLEAVEDKGNTVNGGVNNG